MFDAILTLFRVLVGLLLLAAGLAKIRDRAAFVKVVAHIDLLPQRMPSALGWILPTLEIVTGVLLVIGWQRELVSIVATTLFVAFALFVLFALRKAPTASCGCFGAMSQLSSSLVYRNVGLAMITIAVGTFEVGGWVAAGVLVISLGMLPGLRRTAMRANA